MRKSYTLVIAFLILLFIVLLISCRESFTNSKSILDESYFDWSPPYSYTFVYHDTEYQVKDISELNDKQYQSYYSVEPYIVFLLWDDNSQSILISEEKQSEGIRYYLFKSKGTGEGILLVPGPGDGSVVHSHK